MIPEQITALEDKAARIQASVQLKIQEANRKIVELNRLREEVKAEVESMKAEKQAIEVWKKNLKYMRLKLNKIVDETNLDQSLKQLVKETINV